MKIIVTGCKGQLGTEILKQLREGRSEIGPIPEKLLNATVIAVDLPDLDISNYKMVDEFIRRNRPDVIINCAAYTNVDGCEISRDAAYKVNALGPRNLALGIAGFGEPSLSTTDFSALWYMARLAHKCMQAKQEIGRFPALLQPHPAR